MVDLSEVPAPLRSGYKVRDEKDVLKDYWVYNEDMYPHAEDVLVAVKKYPLMEGERTLTKAEFYVSAHPATALSVLCYISDGSVFEIATGSGRIAEYVQKILPLLDLWGSAMLGIRVQKRSH